MLNHAEIARRIPHQGGMCLLDTVVSWSPDALHARATGHAQGDNPLRRDGRLDAVHGIEYAAQAMAVHGALLADPDDRGTPARQGYLTSVRGVDMTVSRLDDLDGPLDVHVQRLSGDELNILYGFELRHENRVILQGRASVVLDAAALSST